MAPLDPLIIEAFTYLGVSLFLVSFRVYCRLRAGGVASLAADDYIMMFTMVPYIVETSLSYTVGMLYHGLANSGMTDEERAALSPDSEEYKMRVGGSINQVVGWSMYMTVIWLVKASMCAFYGRLTAGLNNYKSRITAGYVLIVVSYLACMICILFSCQPMSKLTQINPYPGNLCQPAVNKLNVYMSMACNLITDVYLLLIPLPLVWGAQIPKLKKASLMFLFSGGIFIIIAGILRCVLILKDEKTGPRAGAEWAVRESFVAVAIANLPMTWSWIRQKLKPYLGSLLSAGKKSYNYKSGPEPGSFKLENRSHSTWRDRSNKSATTQTGGSRTRNEIYTTQGDNSQEEIMHQGGGGIKKEVEYSVSTHDAEVLEPEAGYMSKRYRHDII